MDIRVPLAVAIHADEAGGYWGEVLALPGCYSQAETKAELLRNLREAATLYLTPTETDTEAAPSGKAAESKAIPKRSPSPKPGKPGTSKGKR